MRLVLAAALACLTALILPPAASHAASSTMKLESVVIINRHSVRSPVGDPDSPFYFTKMSKDAWPSFGVPVGNLTKQGTRLSKIMGKYYGKYFSANGLYPAGACLPRKAVLVHADNYQRTVKTAQQMIKGMMPGCRVKVRHLPVPKRGQDGSADPLFDPTGAGICTEDSDKAAQAFEDAVGTPGDIVSQYSGALARTQKVLNCCRATVCSQLGVETKNCTLNSLEDADRIDGAASVTENILMEYATKLPLSQVGWGRARAQRTISKINGPHALLFWGSNANSYSAGVHGSNLAYQIREQLMSAGKRGGQPLTLYVAHDNNLLNIGGILGAEWTLPGYPENEVPPGAGIAFEVWRDKSAGKRYVSVVLRAQSMTQLRKASRLRPDGRTPGTVDLTAQVCGGTGDLCPYGKFMRKLKAALYTPCVDK